MLAWLKKRLKSKTHLFNTLVGAFGILEANFHYLQKGLGANYGWAFVVVAVAGYLLREVTKTPMSEK